MADKYTKKQFIEMYKIFSKDSLVEIVAKNYVRIQELESRQAVNVALGDVSRWSMFRICEKCNKEYELDRQFENGRELISNFQKCPNCGERDDAWVKLKKRTEG